MTNDLGGGGTATLRPATPQDVEHLENLVRDGKPFVNTAPEKPTFRCEVVKELVLRERADRGVEIWGAAIEGLLDLRDARGAGGESCNALLLRDCVLLGKNAGTPGGDPGIDASHSRLRRLSLVDCETDGVELSSAVIDGNLTLNGLRPRSEKGACWVKAPGVRVGGSLTARKAELSLPWQTDVEIPWPPADAPSWQDVGCPYALDLGNARIDGSLELYPEFTSLGGVSLSGAVIGGRLSAAGAELTAAGFADSHEALFAQYVQIGGPVFLSNDTVPANGDGSRREARRFIANGDLWFYGARISGTVVLSGATVTAGRNPWGLNLDSAALSARLILDSYGDGTPCQIPTINLASAVVGELHVEASGRGLFERILGTTLRVGGDVTLLGAMADVDLSGSIVDGEVALGAKHAPLVLIGVEGGGAALRLADTRVGGELRVDGVRTGQRVTVDWDTKPLRIRAVELSCYPGWRLGEALFETSSGSGLAILAFLVPPDGMRVRVLDGTSVPIYELGTNPDLSTPGKAEEYLVLFCSHVWGEEGAFVITPGSVEVSPEAERGAWSATAEVWYGGVLFRAGFLIKADGEVGMPDDEPLRLFERPDQPSLYASPVRWFAPAVSGWPVDPPALGTQKPWLETRPEGEHHRIWAALAQHQRYLPAAEGRWPRGLTRPQADLRGLKVASLNDGNGLCWFGIDKLPDDAGGERPDLQVLLSGFEYDRISDPEQAERQSTTTGSLASLWPSREGAAEAGKGASRGRRLASLARKVGTGLRLARRGFVPALRTIGSLSRHPREAAERLRLLVRSHDKRVDQRLYWLGSQYGSDPPSEDEYRPQPYQQLARTWRAAGHLKAADDITFHMLKVEKVSLTRSGLPRLGRLLHRTKQRLTHLFVEIPFGFGLRPGRAVRTVLLFWAVGVVAILLLPGVLKVDASPVATVVARQADGERVVVEERTTRTAGDEEIDCGDHINEVIYPLDMMIPLIDLRQESRCHISIKHWALSVAQGIYAVLGWVVISGLILTLSGVVRRQIER